MSDEFDFGEGVEDAERPRDRKVDEAKQVLLERYFPADGTEVYYGRQLEVWLEREFFHWITKRALNELAEEHHDAALRAMARAAGGCVNWGENSRAQECKYLMRQVFSVPPMNTRLLVPPALRCSAGGDACCYGDIAGFSEFNIDCT